MKGNSDDKSTEFVEEDFLFPVLLLVDLALAVVPFAAAAEAEDDEDDALPSKSFFFGSIRLSIFYISNKCCTKYIQDIFKRRMRNMLEAIKVL